MPGPSSILGLRIDHKLRAALETIAQKSNLNLSQACRELLREGAQARGFKVGLLEETPRITKGEHHENN